MNPHETGFSPAQIEAFLGYRKTFSAVYGEPIDDHGPLKLRCWWDLGPRKDFEIKHDVRNNPFVQVHNGAMTSYVNFKHNFANRTPEELLRLTQEKLT